MSTKKIETSRFGTLEVDEKAVIEFTAGLPAFPDRKKFTLLGLNADSPFQWLQSLDDSELAFALIEPQRHIPDYHIQVKREELASLEFGKEDRLMIYVILTLNDDPKKATANLRAPLLINARNLLGKQIVLKEEDKPIDYLILDAD